MPIIRQADSPRFALPGLRVLSLASPKRGAAENSVWRLFLEPGAPPVPHTVTREEIFVAVTGTARATLDGRSFELPAGDVLVVPPGVPFALANETAETFEAVVTFPVGGRAVTAEGEFTPPWAE